MKKVSEKDFTIAQLPHNHVDVFKDVFKNHWRMLIVISLILFVALAPYIICHFLRDNYCLSIAIQASQGVIDEKEATRFTVNAHLLFSFFSALSALFFSVILGGVLRIYRQLIWQEPVFFKEDFILGIKNNFKSCFISGIIIGLMIIANKMMLFTNFNIIVCYIPLAVFIAFLLNPILLSVCQSTFYTNKYRAFLKNSFLMYIKEAPSLILFSLVLISPVFLEIIDSIIVLKYILIIVVTLFLFPLFILMYYINSSRIFDRFINYFYYPTIYRKGIYDMNNKEIKLDKKDNNKNNIENKQ